MLLFRGPTKADLAICRNWSNHVKYCTTLIRFLYTHLPTPSPSISHLSSQLEYLEKLSKLPDGRCGRRSDAKRIYMNVEEKLMPVNIYF